MRISLLKIIAVIIFINLLITPIILHINNNLTITPPEDPDIETDLSTAQNFFSTSLPNEEITGQEDWFDTFNDETKIDYKSNIVVSNSNARLNSKELFLITSTSDFDAGKKNYIETINDYGNIADGAIQIKLGDIYADNFVTETDGLSPPINWTLDTKKPVLQKFEIDNVRARTNSNSPRCIWIKGPTSSDGDAHHDFMSPYITADEVPFELWVYLPSYSQHNIKVAQQATTGDWDNNEVMAFLGFMQGKNIEYNWGGWIDTGFDWTIGWHRVRIYHNFTLDGWYCMYDGTRVPAAGYLPPRNSGKTSIRALHLNSAGTGPEAWWDDIKVGYYYKSASWESAVQTLSPGKAVKDTIITFENLSSGVSEIDRIEWLVGGVVKATYETDIENDGLSPLSIIESDLTSGSFANINSDFTIKIYLTGDGNHTPEIKQVEGKDPKTMINGTLLSTPITMPANNVWDFLNINKSEPANSYINITVLNGTTDQPIPGYIDITSSSLNISSIDPIKFQTIKLRANFTSNDLNFKFTRLFDWSLSWKPDYPKMTSPILSSYSFPEDTDAYSLIDLDQYFEDVWTTDENLTYEITFQSDISKIYGIVNGTSLDFQSQTDNWSGFQTFIVNCTDEGGLSRKSNMFMVWISEVNDPPIWSTLDNVKLPEDSPSTKIIECDGNITDCDDVFGNITYTIITNDNSNNILVEVNNRCLYAEPLVEHYFGNANISVRADDGTDQTDFDFKVIIEPVNDPPVWTDIYKIFTSEDIDLPDVVDLTGNITDVDNSTLDIEFEIINNQSPLYFFVSIDQNNMIDIDLKFENYVGSTNITVRASDGINYSDEQFEVIINPINDAPVWEKIDDIHIDEDSSIFDALDLEKYITDIDTDISNIDFSIEKNTNSVNIGCYINSQNKLDINTLTENYVGSTILTIRASDEDKSVDTSFDIFIDPINDIPVWNLISDIHLDEDTNFYDALYLPDYVTDIETDSINIGFAIMDNSNSNNVGVRIDSLNNIDITTPTENYIGSAIISVRADDGTDFADTDFEVFINSVNDPPVWKVIGDVHLDEDTDEIDAVRLDKHITDVDNKLKDFTFTVENNPNSENITVRIKTNYYVDVLTPVENYFGSTIVTIRASDGINYSDVQVNIYVDPTDDPPDVEIIYPLEGMEFRPDDIINLNCTVTDYDLDYPGSTDYISVIWYSSQELQPLGSNFNLGTVNLGLGEHNITVRAVDSSGADDLDYVNIIIKEKKSTGTSSNVLIYSIIGIIIVVIVIALALVLFLKKRKAKLDETFAVKGLAKTGFGEPALLPDRISPPVSDATTQLSAIRQSQGITNIPTFQPSTVTTAPSYAAVQLAGLPSTPLLPPAVAHKKETVAPAPTPTLTPTPKLTSPPSPSPTLKQTSIQTPSQTPTPTPTLSPTQPSSPTPGQTPTPTPTPTLKPTPTPTLSPTTPLSPTPGQTPTPTPTPSPTPLPTLKPNPTLVPSPTPVPTPTISPTTAPTLKNLPKLKETQTQ